MFPRDYVLHDLLYGLFLMGVGPKMATLRCHAILSKPVERMIISMLFDILYTLHVVMDAGTAMSIVESPRVSLYTAGQQVSDGAFSKKVDPI